MSDKHGSPREANESTETPPDAPEPVASQGGPSRGLPRKVRAVRIRDMDGLTQMKVRLIHGEVFMNHEAAEFLRGFNAVLPPYGLVTPADGERYLLGLIASLRGYMSAEVGE